MTKLGRACEIHAATCLSIYIQLNHFCTEKQDRISIAKQENPSLEGNSTGRKELGKKCVKEKWSSKPTITCSSPQSRVQGSNN
jgi:hypothetical protein